MAASTEIDNTFRGIDIKEIEYISFFDKKGKSICIKGESIKDLRINFKELFVFLNLRGGKYAIMYEDKIIRGSLKKYNG